MLHELDPEIYAEFKLGKWVVKKNLYAPFCAVGPDNAMEHVNRSMKVSGGLVAEEGNNAQGSKQRHMEAKCHWKGVVW